MRFELPPEAEDHRADVREFLGRHVGPDGTLLGDLPRRDWFRIVADAGYVAPHWPRPWGLDAGPIQQLVIQDEIKRSGVPMPVNLIGIGWAGPTLLVAGSEELQKRYLPTLLDASEIWCQLFSEPGAGSDLAGLQTRAVRDGDVYVVNGQKVWSTYAQDSRFGILLARTDPDAPKHHGISYFVLDMSLPGVEVRPIRQMTGEDEFNEVFFTDVRVPADHLVGAEGDGWRLARVTLANERVSLSGEGARWGEGPTAHDLVELVRSRGGAPDGVMRQRLARLYIEAEILQLIRFRTLTARLKGLEPGVEASVRKALADPHGRDVFRIAKDLSGAAGMLAHVGPFGTDPGEWASGFLFSPALTIGGGTSEVQRNILAERVLGLPRDVAGVSAPLTRTEGVSPV